MIKVQSSRTNYEENNDDLIIENIEIKEENK